MKKLGRVAGLCLGILAAIGWGGQGFMLATQHDVNNKVEVAAVEQPERKHGPVLVLGAIEFLAKVVSQAAHISH